jgi:hypothetical protein
MKSENRHYEDHSNYSGLLVIYLVTAAVAATAIFPGEEYWYFGILKSLLWPFYIMTKFL